MNKVLGIGVVVAVVLSLLAVIKPAPEKVITVTNDNGDKLGAVVGPEVTSEFFCVNGTCTWNKTGTFNDASTTLFAVQNPWRATTSASLIVTIPDSTTSTTSVTVTCATSTTAYPTTLSVGNTLVSSSSIGANVGAAIYSGVTSGSTGVVSAGASSVREIILAPTDYVACLTAASAGVTDGGNTFNGRYRAIFRKN